MEMPRLPYETFLLYIPPQRSSWYTPPPALKIRELIQLNSFSGSSFPPPSSPRAETYVEEPGEKSEPKPGGNSRSNTFIYMVLTIAALALLFYLFRSFAPPSRDASKIIPLFSRS
jgi:hypothetical protein